MRTKSLAFLLIPFLAGGAVLAAGISTTTTWSAPAVSEPAGMCVDLSTACSQSVTASTPAWQQELKKVQASGDACLNDINTFCEGVQVGQGRIEHCLKAHAKKLSPKCKTAQGLK